MKKIDIKKQILYDKHFLEIKGITFTPQAIMEKVQCQTMTVEIKEGEDSRLPFGRGRSSVYMYMDISETDMCCFLGSVFLMKSQKTGFSYQ